MYQVVQRGISGLTYNKDLNEYIDVNESVIEAYWLLLDSQLNLQLEHYQFRHPYLTNEECVKENRKMLAKALWNARKLGWKYKKVSQKV